MTFYISIRQSENWKQNSGENGANVNHRDRCSQRLVTEILKPLWNRLGLQLDGYGVEIILAVMNPFSTSDCAFPPSSVISLCNARKPVLVAKANLL